MHYGFTEHNYVISHVQCVITPSMTSMCWLQTREGKMAGVALIHTYIPVLEYLEKTHTHTSKTQSQWQMQYVSFNIHCLFILKRKENKWPQI